MTELFNSVYTGVGATVNPLMLALSLLTSLLLGYALASVYRYKTLYTKEFVITLTILPSLLAVIIFLVNGSLGTSVAVAGTFGLVRFRSASGGSRELLSLFLAMTIGLSTGMGYLLLGILSTLIFLLVWLLLEKMTFFSSGQTVRYLTLSFGRKFQDDEVLNGILNQFCQDYNLISIKTGKNGNELKLIYHINLKNDSDDILLTRKILEYGNNIDVSITKNAKKKKTL